MSLVLVLNEAVAVEVICLAPFPPESSNPTHHFLASLSMLSSFIGSPAWRLSLEAAWLLLGQELG
jgi:hypothetical protein